MEFTEFVLNSSPDSPLTPIFVEYQNLWGDWLPLLSDPIWVSGHLRFIDVAECLS